MANPQKENGYTAIANEIMEHLSQTKLTDYQSRILHALWRKTYGFQKKTDVISLSQWSTATNIDTHNVPRTIRELSTRNIITVKHITPKTVEYQFQKNYELWDKTTKTVINPTKKIEPLFTSNQILSDTIVSNEILSNTILSNQSGDTIKPDVQVLSNQIDTKENIQKKHTKDNIYTIFNFWNEQNIVIHKEPNGSGSAINNALKTYTVDELKQAIKNYSEILHDQTKYYWSHKWTLKDFIHRGVDKFLDGDVARSNYARNKENGVRVNAVKNVDIQWTG